MIFVTVGSTDFDALVRRMDGLSPQLGEPVIMQIGSGAYLPQHASQYFRYAPSLEPYFDQAEIIVSHGGLGTIVEVLRKGKKLIAASNPDRYDAHQEDLLEVLSEARHLIWCRDLDQLPAELQRIRRLELALYCPPECRIHEVIRGFLSQRVRARP